MVDGEKRRTPSWVERTPPGFVFNIKAYRFFTGHQTPVISLPKHLREALGPVDKKNVYNKDEARTMGRVSTGAGESARRQQAGSRLALGSVRAWPGDSRGCTP
jgi:uncharacterized protein YecE (DUF72 family)